jgi:uncharacterized protein YqjF (DUF2071 family)
MPVSTPHPIPTPRQRMAERERPNAAPVLRQRWEHLLFVHWRWDPLQVQRTLPRGLTVDTYHGGAWVGLTPLFLHDVRPSFLPALPLISNYLELGLRTYVHDAEGRPGVYFYSLDCNQPVVVEGARRFLFLKYEHSVMDGSVGPDGFVDFRSQRAGVETPDLFRYRAHGHATAADPATLDFFLVERYRLFTGSGDGHLVSLRTHHPSFGLRKVESLVLDPVTMRLGGFDPQGRAPDHIALADPVDVELFAPEMLG